MTTPRDPDRLIRAFLDEGPHALPDRTYDAVRDNIDRTRQRVVIGPWRESHMNNIAKVAIALAAVVVVAIVGLNLLPARTATGGPGPSPSPSPSPSPGPSGSAAIQYLPPAGPIAAGTYDAISETDLVPFSFTVPAGWTSEGWFITNAPDPVDTRGYKLRLTFIPVGNAYADPCQGTLAEPAIGPKVDDLATALMSLPGTTASTTKDVVLDGRNAKLVEYTVREDNTCPKDQFGLWPDPVGDGGFYTWPPYGDLVRTWILDVDGHRFVMMADIQTGTSEADQGELQQVVDSVTFGG
jgi:hypothetical protein